MCFVGQATKNGKSFTQKDQLQVGLIMLKFNGKVIERFQNGNYNVLVSTSIGEEGLDIGEVDMIICYDTQSSPVRMLQRMGRTGRKRDGRIVLLLSEGKEEQQYKKTQTQYKSVQRAIQNQNRSFQLWLENPRMIPTGMVRPVCRQMRLEISDYEKPVRNAPSRKTSSMLDRLDQSENPFLSTIELNEFMGIRFKSTQRVGSIDKALQTYSFMNVREAPVFLVGHGADSNTLVSAIKNVDAIKERHELDRLDGAVNDADLIAAWERRLNHDSKSRLVPGDGSIDDDDVPQKPTTAVRKSRKKPTAVNVDLSDGMDVDLPQIGKRNDRRISTEKLNTSTTMVFHSDFDSDSDVAPPPVIDSDWMLCDNAVDLLDEIVPEPHTPLLESIDMAERQRFDAFIAAQDEIPADFDFQTPPRRRQKNQAATPTLPDHAFPVINEGDVDQLSMIFKRLSATKIRSSQGSALVGIDELESLVATCSKILPRNDLFDTFPAKPHSSSSAQRYRFGIDVASPGIYMLTIMI
jgi:hypothetical protein